VPRGCTAAAAAYRHLLWWTLAVAVTLPCATPNTKQVVTKQAHHRDHRGD
jgi:1,4-dihydroxy-2-naphthoate octaprenyltransferase